MKKIYLFKFKYILSLLIIILIIKKIETIPYFKTLYSSEAVYIINYDGIYTYNFGNNRTERKLLFTKKLESENEFEMISYDRIYFILSTLILVKTNLYVMPNGNNFTIPLDQVVGYQEIYSNKCFGTLCYFLVGCINSNKELYLYLFNKTIGNDEIKIVNKFIINSVGSDNFSCQKNNYLGIKRCLLAFIRIIIQN